MTTSKPFEARYEGYCRARCGNPIEIGDMIRATEDGPKHEECVEEYNPIKAPKDLSHPQCMVCFLMHPPGSCDRM